MNRGNWVPISKALVKKLPTDREFSEIEAMFSLTVNYDCVNPVSVSGLASRWMWSRKRVDNFLKKLGVTIDYEDKFDRHKRGQVGYQVGNRIGTGGEQVEFIDSRYLPATRNRRGTGEEQVGNRKGSTIKEPNPKPKPNPKDKETKTTTFNVISFRPDWISEQDWKDIITHRRKHPRKPPETERAYKGILDQLQISQSSGYSLAQCLDKWLNNSSWQTFKAEYMEGFSNSSSKKPFQTKHDINDQIQNIGAAINERTGFNPYTILEAGDSSGDVNQDRRALPE